MIIYKSIESDKVNDNQNITHKTQEKFQTNVNIIISIWLFYTKK